MAAARAGRTWSARQPAGRATSRTDRLVRSTRVSTAEGRLPNTRSPSQCPGTDRLVASAGRWRIETVSMSWPRPWGRRLPCGWRMARPVRRQRRRARRSAPRGAHTGSGRWSRGRRAWSGRRGKPPEASPLSAPVTSTVPAWPPPPRGVAALPPAWPAWVGRLAGRQPHQRAGPDTGGGRRCEQAPATPWMGLVPADERSPGKSHRRPRPG
jgi:hypothetical protein